MQFLLLFLSMPRQVFVLGESRFYVCYVMCDMICRCVCNYRGRDGCELKQANDIYDEIIHTENREI